MKRGPEYWKRRGPSLEEDLADLARKKELKDLGKFKRAAAGSGQLSALADKWGAKLSPLKKGGNK